MRWLALLILFPAVASAQQMDQARTAGAVPTLIQQRNGAMDALAICGGDLQTLQQKLTETEKALKAKTDELEGKTKP